MSSLAPPLATSIACLVLAACATTTSTHTPASPDVTRLKRVAVVVRGPSQLAVFRDRERMTSAGALAGGLLGATIESGARTSSDLSFAETMTPALGNFDGVSVLRERLLAALRATPAFASAESTSITEVAVIRQAGFDALLDLEIPEWGLRLCTALSGPEDLQVMYRARGRLLTSMTAPPLWERHQLFIDGECRLADAWRRETGLLVSVLTRAADRLAGRLVKDLLFP